ncbi:acetylornithine deacetylase [Neisseriaceae bacterium JH1-16]|nr:acetylornithine deacetylase [Neisseriaceae bacterium JH1-16]
MRRRSHPILERLIGFDTVSSRPNLALIEYIRDYLAEQGVTSELFLNDDTSKASLFATIGPTDRGGVVLSGHTDVVPAAGQAWTVEPFALSERDGRLYGRGTADMKGFIASVLAAVPLFVARPLVTPVHLAFSYDEEIGCLGVRPMLENLAARPIKPIACIIGEPTEMRPVGGHKGKLAMRCQIHGAECHSAYAPYGVNAIQAAARLVTRLEAIGERLAQHEQCDPRFDPPFSTVQTGLIQGGRALNIVPGHCEFEFEVRSLPGFDARQVVDELRAYAEADLQPGMRSVKPETGIAFHPLSSYPGLDADMNSYATRLLQRLTGEQQFGTVAFGTEGGLFSEAGIPAVVCGPGSMDQGHKPDEFITVEQMAECDRFMDRLAEMLCEPL